MSKASVKHYLNKNLKPVAINNYPVYIRVIHKRNPQRIVSVLLNDVYLTEREFENNETIQYIIKKESEIILYIYDLLQEKIKDFDIRKYKGKTIRDVLVYFVNAFALNYSEGANLQTIKWESVANFIHYIEKNLDIKIKEDSFWDYTECFFDLNESELKRLGLISNGHREFFGRVNPTLEYKYNIGCDTDKYFISKAKEESKNKELKEKTITRLVEAIEPKTDEELEETVLFYDHGIDFKHIADCLYCENLYNLLTNEKMQRDYKRNGAKVEELKEYMIKNIIHYFVK